MVELLIALALFGLMAAGLASLTLQSRRISEGIIFEDQVNRSIQNFVEEIRGIGFERIRNTYKEPSAGFDLTLPGLDSTGAVEIVNCPVAIIDEKEISSQWTTVDIETTTMDGDSATVPVGLRIELNDHNNLSSENTNGIEVIIHYSWKFPWANSDEMKTNEAIAYMADESP